MGAQNTSTSHDPRNSKGATPAPFSSTAPSPPNPAALRLRHWLRVSWSRPPEALGENDALTAAYVEPVPVDTVLTRAAHPGSVRLRFHLDDIPDLVQALFNAAGATELALSPASLNQAHTPGMARKCHPPTQRP